MRYSFEYSVVDRVYDTHTIEADTIKEAEEHFFNWADPYFPKDADLRIEMIVPIEENTKDFG